METFKNVKEMEIFEVEDTANMFWIKTCKTRRNLNKKFQKLHCVKSIIQKT